MLNCNAHNLLFLGDPEFRMWMWIGIGLGAFAGATFLWVLFNRSTQKKRSRRESFAQYGTMTKDAQYRGSGKKETVSIDPSKVMGEYHDKP